jgi:hypothetical protein
MHRAMTLYLTCRHLRHPVRPDCSRLILLYHKQRTRGRPIFEGKIQTSRAATGPFSSLDLEADSPQRRREHRAGAESLSGFSLRGLCALCVSAVNRLSVYSLHPQALTCSWSQVVVTGGDGKSPLSVHHPSSPTTNSIRRTRASGSCSVVRLLKTVRSNSRASICEPPAKPLCQWRS